MSVNNQQPLVSVVMNCYNSSKYLREAIDSVIKQTYSNWEIIFWDNASSDESPDIVKSYSDVRIKYFRGGQTVPLGHARNYALEKCKGDYIGFLDCDDIWFPEKLEKQIPLFNDEKVDIVYSDTFFFNNEGKQWRLYKSKSYYTGYCFSQLLSQYFLSLETVVIRKSALDRLSYWFDERFSTIEEADLFRRIAYSGKLAMVNEVLAKWRIHASSYTWNKIKDFVLETEQMLDIYNTIYPRFSEQYAKAIIHLRARLLVGEARFYWQSGASSEARKLIASYKFPKTLLVYLMFFATFFPGQFFNKIKA
ncbi:MAG: glycosyltransferase family 2 protein [Sphingobacteriaceae bacterium]|nr:glycosyltransferase family 2 protein [Sphingobacteriaceae bacterium]